MYEIITNNNNKDCLSILFNYEGILESSKDDFEDGDEVYEAIGQVLHEVADKSENEVRSVITF